MPVGARILVEAKTKKDREMFRKRWSSAWGFWEECEDYVGWSIVEEDGRLSSSDDVNVSLSLCRSAQFQRVSTRWKLEILRAIFSQS